MRKSNISDLTVVLWQALDPLNIVSKEPQPSKPATCRSLESRGVERTQPCVAGGEGVVTTGEEVQRVIAEVIGAVGQGFQREQVMGDERREREKDGAAILNL